MRFRIIHIVQWTTALAVVLAFSSWAASKQTQIARPLAILYIAAFWLPVLATFYLAGRWLLKGRNDWWAIVCAVIGGIAAYVLAYHSEFGYAIYTWQHHDAAVNEAMVRAYGCRIGAATGAFAGALAGGIARMILRQPRGQQPQHVCRANAKE